MKILYFDDFKLGVLKGENVDYTYRDKTTEIAWQHHAAGIRKALKLTEAKPAAA